MWAHFQVGELLLRILKCKESMTCGICFLQYLCKELPPGCSPSFLFHNFIPPIAQLFSVFSGRCSRGHFNMVQCAAARKFAIAEYAVNLVWLSLHTRAK